MKTTKEEIEGTLKRLSLSMRRAGLLDEGGCLLLQHGSKVNGNSYGLTIITGDQRRIQPFGSLHFGFTKAECQRSLYALTVALEAVNAHQEMAKALEAISV